MNILITKPLPFATILADKLKALHHNPILYPTLLIEPVRPAPDLSILTTADKCIVNSRQTVRFLETLIGSQLSKLPLLQWLAIGPGTAVDLKKLGVHAILTPEHPPYESETLLALPALQSIQNSHICLIKGEGGRGLLESELKKRGAQVTCLDLYKRTLPKLAPPKLPLDVIITTSADSLKNLSLLAGDSLNALQDLPIVVVGSRMVDLATSLGFRHTYTATGADDLSIINVLSCIKEPQH